MSEPTEQRIPEPDPAWDYYPAWHSLLFVKAKIEAALKLMALQEEGGFWSAQEIKLFLLPASQKLAEVIESDLDYPDPNDD